MAPEQIFVNPLINKGFWNSPETFGIADGGLPLRQNLSQHEHARTSESAYLCDKFLISPIAAFAFVRADS